MTALTRFQGDVVAPTFTQAQKISEDVTCVLCVGGKMKVESCALMVIRHSITREGIVHSLHCYSLTLSPACHFQHHDKKKKNK